MGGDWGGGGKKQEGEGEEEREKERKKVSSRDRQYKTVTVVLHCHQDVTFTFHIISWSKMAAQTPATTSSLQTARRRQGEQQHSVSVSSLYPASLKVQHNNFLYI